jgi:hypothetical protein
MLRPTVSRPVCLGVKHPSETFDQICITVRQLGFVDVGRCLWRRNGSAVYNCCWSSPGSESRGTRDHILLSQIRDSPNLEDQVPVFIYPRNRVARLYPQSLGSLFVASYDSQGYSGIIRTRLIELMRSFQGSLYRPAHIHGNFFVTNMCLLKHSLLSNRSSIVDCVGYVFT